MYCYGGHHEMMSANRCNVGVSTAKVKHYMNKKQIFYHPFQNVECRDAWDRGCVMVFPLVSLLI